MPRKIRVEYPGAIYHILSRGDRGEDIFLDDVDRQDFLKMLAEACQKTGWQVPSCCVGRIACGDILGAVWGGIWPRPNIDRAGSLEAMSCRISQLVCAAGSTRSRTGGKKITRMNYSIG